MRRTWGLTSVVGLAMVFLARGSSASTQLADIDVAIKWVGPGGSNGSDGDTRSTRWLDDTNFTAVNLSAGDTIYMIGPTSHPYAINPTVAGAEGAKITLRAEPGQGNVGPLAGDKTSTPVVLDGTGVGNVDAATWPDHWVLGGDGAGFAIRNWEKGASQIASTTGVQFNGMQLKDCGAVSGNDAVNSENAAEVDFFNTQISHIGLVDAGGVGLFGKGMMTDFSFRYGTIHNVEDDMMKVHMTDGLIEFSNLYDSFGVSTVHQDGIVGRRLLRVVCRCNTIYNSSQLFYGPLKDDAAYFWDDVQIYCNVMYADRRYQDFGDPEPAFSNTLIGVFCDASPAVAANTIRNVEIFKNSFGYLGLNAILLDSDTNPTIRTGVRSLDNLFFHCKGTASGVVEINNIAAITSMHNAYWISAVYAGETGGKEVTSDPKLVDYNGQTHEGSFNMRPTQSSPLLEAGHPDLGSVATLPATFLDRDGNVRNKFGGTIGAYEGVGARSHTGQDTPIWN